MLAIEEIWFPKRGYSPLQKIKTMENAFNLSYQKQLFCVAQKAIDFKKSILKETFFLANSGKEKEQDSLLGIMNFLKRKQVKTNDSNVAEIILLLQCIDETVLKLESKLELKNDFKKDVFDKEIYWDQKNTENK